MRECADRTDCRTANQRKRQQSAEVQQSGFTNIVSVQREDEHDVRGARKLTKKREVLPTAVSSKTKRSASKLMNPVHFQKFHYDQANSR